jgi:hypothetical protein
MRRQNSHIVNGALIVGGATALVDISLQWIEHKGKGVDFSWENYNRMRILKRFPCCCRYWWWFGLCLLPLPNKSGSKAAI